MMDGAGQWLGKRCKSAGYKEMREKEEEMRGNGRRRVTGRRDADRRERISCKI